MPRKKREESLTGVYHWIVRGMNKRKLFHGTGNYEHFLGLLREYKNQYFLIRQAFEQDKKDGFKGCLEAKPGDACMGRATQALIQSDYFPW